MDYGFHPPTVYFPLIVDEALMIEPTETESKETLDAFCEAMLAIAREAEGAAGAAARRAAQHARAPSRRGGGRAQARAPLAEGDGAMRSSWFICVIAALALVLSACGGGEKPAHTLDDAELREMVMITSEGLPWAISLVRDQAVSNEAAASEYPDPEQWLRNYEEWGRVSGYEAEFRIDGRGHVCRGARG